MHKKARLKLPFDNRLKAGRLLGQALAEYAKRSDVIVLALPRGGVPVGSEVARIIDAVLNADLVETIGIGQEAIEAATIKEQQELERREWSYRGDYPRPQIQDRCVILVDDGLALNAGVYRRTHID